MNGDRKRIDPASTGGRSANARSGRVALRKPADQNKNSENRALEKKLNAELEAKKDREWNENIVRTSSRPDRILTALIIILLCLGTVTVFSASYPTALAKLGDGAYYLKRQIIYVALGLVAMVGLSSIGPGFKINWLKNLAPLIYAVATLFLIAVLFIGTNEGVAKRWIFIGPISFQPSEFMKFAMVVMLAWYIDKFRDKVLSRSHPKFRRGTRLASLKSFMMRVGWPCVIIGAACVLVLLENHLSGTVILGTIGVTVLAIGGTNLIEALGLIVCGGAAAGGLFLMKNSYALERILTHAGGNADIRDGAWQSIQGLYAIGSGGILGLGLGSSRLKYSYIYAAHTDFIFSIWCEEMGFVGAVFLLLIYFAFVWRGYIIAMKAPDTFSSLVVFGIITHVAVQVLTNVAVVTGIFPNTGVTLPFFSFGGTSTVILLAEMGIVLSISRHSYVRK